MSRRGGRRSRERKDLARRRAVLAATISPLPGDDDFPVSIPLAELGLITEHEFKRLLCVHKLELAANKSEQVAAGADE
jgi:hypothetical protein